MLIQLNMTEAEFEAYRETHRVYRDKFLAHLDSERRMNPPHLEIARKSVFFYHSHLVSGAAGEANWRGLPDSAEEFQAGYDRSFREAADAYHMVGRQYRMCTIW